MDDLEVATFWRKGAPGTLSIWSRCLIGATTVATIVVAYLSWHVLWDLYGCDDRFYGFWVRNGVWLGLLAMSLAALVPPSGVSRFIRLATLLPVFHLAALVASVALWLPIQEHAEDWGRVGDMMMMPAHVPARVAIGSLVIVGCAWLIHRREWLQTMLLLALTFLLLLGAWLPYCAATWFHSSGHRLDTTLLAPRTFLANAIVPPLIAALGFTALATRRPTFAKKWRGWTITIVSFLLAIAALSQLGPEKDSTVLYLNAAQLVLMAQSFAIAAVVVVGVAMWLAARRARLQLHASGSERGTIADPDGDREPVVELQLDGWLRAPRIERYPFEVITAHDRVPVGGAPVLWSVPPATTRLASGEGCVVLRRGDVVTVYRRDVDTAGHPFRSARHADVLAIAAPEAGTGFTNVMLMMWRPATAYVAITLAIMVPAALALLAA